MDTSSRTSSRLVMTIAFTISVLLLGIIGAVAAGTGTVTPPPKIAFVASNITGSPDALTVGPMAGRLGAPLFITNGQALSDTTRDALADYKPSLVIVAGGPNTVSNDVVAAIAAATGLAVKEFDTKPTNGVIRAFGDGRDETAAKLADLLANYNPKFLPVDATALGAVDADKLDGHDSSDFFAIPLLPGHATLRGHTSYQHGQNAGILVSTDGGDGLPSFGWTVQLPPDFPTGGSATARLLYSSSVSGCTFDLTHIRGSAWRIGQSTRKPIAMSGPGSIQATGDEANIAQVSLTITGEDGSKLTAGDFIWFGAFRNFLTQSDDNCGAGTFVVHGGTLTY